MMFRGSFTKLLRPQMLKDFDRSYSLGFKVSEELMDTDLYDTYALCHSRHRTGVSEIFPGKLWFPKVKKYPPPLEDWPPKPDDLNVKWWKK